jgi:hypothetical protein
VRALAGLSDAFRRATDTEATIGRTGIKSTIRRGNRSSRLAGFRWLLRSNHSSRSCWLGWVHAVGPGRLGGATPPWEAFCRKTNGKQAGCLQVPYLLRRFSATSTIHCCSCGFGRSRCHAYNTVYVTRKHGGSSSPTRASARKAPPTPHCLWCACCASYLPPVRSWNVDEAALSAASAHARCCTMGTHMWSSPGSPQLVLCIELLRLQWVQGRLGMWSGIASPAGRAM